MTNNLEVGTTFDVDNEMFYEITSLSPNEVKVIHNPCERCDYSGDVVIPESVEWNGGLFSVTEIGEEAFNNLHVRYSVAIPNPKSLTSVTIPNTVTKIGKSAFTYCCALKSVNIPDSVTEIGARAFVKCYSLQSITISKSVTKVGEDIFENCYFQSIKVDEENRIFTSIDGVLFDKDVTTLLKYPNRKGDSEYIIPPGVIKIAKRAFGCNDLTSITFPNSLKEIGDEAIHCSSLADITLPDSLTKIGEKAFSNCKELTSITIPATVTEIGSSAFSCFELTNFTILGAETPFRNDILDGCDALVSIDVSENSTQFSSIDGVIFNKDQTTLIMYPQGKVAEHYTIPDSVTTIGKEAFKYCNSLTSITLPDSLTEIESGAFNCCSSLSAITLHYSVKTIGSGAFYGCSSLTSITLPYSVTTIGEELFAYCKSLTSIDVSENSTHFSSIDGVLFNKDQTTLLRYPQGKDAEHYTIPDSVKEIGDSAFWFCEYITTVALPDSLIKIGKLAFSGCDSLTSITLPDFVTTIGESAFSSCSSLTSISLPDSVTEIGERAFEYCSSLKTIISNISENVAKVGFSSSGFDDDTEGRSLYVPKDKVDEYKNSIWSQYTKNILPIE